MDIADWRKKIDELDRRLVELLSERARAAVEIGRLKRDTSLPIYEPERERVVFENVQTMNRGPLPGKDLVRIFARIMEVVRVVGAKRDRQVRGPVMALSQIPQVLRPGALLPRGAPERQHFELLRQ